MIKDRVKTVHRAVLNEQDVLVCDYNSAMSRDIVRGFNRHITLVGNTRRIPFSKVAAVSVLHKSLEVAILLGHPADQRFELMPLACRGRDEAITTCGRSTRDSLAILRWSIDHKRDIDSGRPR